MFAKKTLKLYYWESIRNSSKTPPTTGVDEDMGKKEPSYTAGGNAS
jgi:hypothetical protein